MWGALPLLFWVVKGALALPSRVYQFIEHGSRLGDPHNDRIDESGVTGTDWRSIGNRQHTDGRLRTVNLAGPVVPSVEMVQMDRFSLVRLLLRLRI